jgi:signal transduction histidine kinase
MNDIIARSPSGSIEQACALALRADLRGELLEVDLAAADGIAAYTMSESAGFIEPRIQAAASLATVYRRSGLLADADRMIDEMTQYSRTRNHLPDLAATMYLRGQVQIDAGNYQAARKTLEESRRVAERAGDRFGAAYTDVALCPALISEGDYDAAERVCSAHVEDYAAAKRDDLVTLMLIYKARLDLERGRPAAALAKLDEVLGPRAADILPLVEPQIYHDRSRAYGALGRFDAAYVDLMHSLALQHTLDVTQRSRAAAVLKAKAEGAKLAAEHRTQARRQRIAVTLAGSLVSALIGYLLWMRRRDARHLRRQQNLLHTASSNAPDTLMLLDARRIIRFANRALFGHGRTPLPGDTLHSGVSNDTWETLQPALNEVYECRRPGTLSMTVTDESGAARQFELRCVPVLEGAEVIGATLRSIDVTEVRSLEREVLDIATRERQRMSSDLHDGLGQELTGISLLLQNLAVSIDRGKPGIRGLVDEIMTYVKHTIGTTRELAYGLSPLHIERGSLSDAIARLAAEAGRRLHLQITASSEPGSITVPEAAANELYRIVFEAVTNAARHSGCSKIDIAMLLSDGRLRLTVKDDGAGLPPEGATQAGLGLTTMAYRARLLGGTVRLEPGTPVGAQLTIAVPMTPAGAAG